MRQLLAILIILTTTTSVCAQTSPPPAGTKIRLKNVQLSEEGTLRGRYISVDGKAVADTPLTFNLNGQKYTTTKDNKGRFEIALPAGNCIVDAEGQAFACRLWTARTAPPGALKSVAVVKPQNAVRGQQGNNYSPFLPPTTQLTSLGPSGRVLVSLGLIGGATIAIVHLAQDAS